MVDAVAQPGHLASEGAQVAFQRLPHSKFGVDRDDCDATCDASCVPDVGPTSDAGAAAAARCRQLQQDERPCAAPSWPPSSGQAGAAYPAPRQSPFAKAGANAPWRSPFRVLACCFAPPPAQAARGGAADALQLQQAGPCATDGAAAARRLQQPEQQQPELRQQVKALAPSEQQQAQCYMPGSAAAAGPMLVEGSFPHVTAHYMLPPAPAAAAEAAPGAAPPAALAAPRAAAAAPPPPPAADSPIASVTAAPPPMLPQFAFAPPAPPRVYTQAVIGAKRPEDLHKKTLVLDLDETLVHSSFKPIPNPDYIIPVEIDGRLVDVYVLKRPWLDHFMATVGPRFEVVVFTASLAKYADPLLDLMDKTGCVRWRLFREACCPFEGNYVKDLLCLGRSLSSTIIVDNSPHSYIFQPDNAVPIGTFIDNMEDQELLEILPQLLKVEAVDDVRALLGPQNVANYHMQQQQAAAHAGAPQGQCCGGSAAAAAVAAAAAAAAANAAAAAAAAAVDGCEGSGSGSASVYCGGAGGGASASAAVNVRLGLPPPPMAAAPAPTPLGVRG